MKIKIILIAFIVLTGCQLNRNEMIRENTYKFFVGTYTGERSIGIYSYALDDSGTIRSLGLAAHSEDPSFLAISTDNRFLLAVNEVDQEGSGSIASFSIAGDSLLLINKRPSGGAHPCYITVNKAGFVLTANYTGGNVGLLRLNKKGELSPLLDVQQHSGHGSTGRQEGPHAHSVRFAPRSDQIISVDLGTNELWFSKLDTINKKLVPAEPNKLPMKPGAGPRHLVFHPSGPWIYVVNELDCTITQVRFKGEGSYELGSSVSTLPEGFSEPNTCADIHISSDGKFVYVSNRGHNSLAIFEVATQTGLLSLQGHQSTHGDGPRNFALSPDEKHIVVANQNTNNLVSFQRDQVTGLLTFKNAVKANRPVCVVFREKE